MIDTRFLPDRTRALFERLTAEPLLSGFTLVGGSALALQIGHRLSEDLDFNFFGGRLPTGKISSLLSALESEGFEIQDLISYEKKSTFRINAGHALNLVIQDFSIGGAKVSFHSRTEESRPKAQMDFLKAADRAQFDAAGGFDILGVGGLFVMKSIVLFDRAKSRDIFDLMVLTRDHGYSMADMENAVAKFQPPGDRDFERCKAVLMGKDALDKDDEGFDGVGISESVEALYAYFQKMVNAHEVFLAETIARSAKRNRTPPLCI